MCWPAYCSSRKQKATCIASTRLSWQCSGLILHVFIYFLSGGREVTPILSFIAIRRARRLKWIFEKKCIKICSIHTYHRSYAKNGLILRDKGTSLKTKGIAQSYIDETLWYYFRCQVNLVCEELCFPSYCVCAYFIPLFTLSLLTWGKHTQKNINSWHIYFCVPQFCI